MALESPHPLILCSRVISTPVFNREGEPMGHVEDLSIDKVSGQVIYAILSFSGFLGLGERLYPLPWALLDYDPDKLSYVVALETSQLDNAPSLRREDLEELGSDAWRKRVFDYYAPRSGGVH